jgi:hypothetical protein
MCLTWLAGKNLEVIGGTEHDSIDSINRTQSFLFISDVVLPDELVGGGGSVCESTLLVKQSKILIDNQI